MFNSDTIAAISTPIGEGGIGIIRLSGPDVKTIALRILTSPSGNFFADFTKRHVYFGKVVAPETKQVLDEVLFFYTVAPHSFTGEDTVEIQAHGGTYLLSRILEVCLNAGARQAEPGEFTQRAFLNGKIDLVQAESVIDLIRAKTDKAHELAFSQLSGSVSHRIHALENVLYQILITIEALLDFPEEGIPEIQRDRYSKQVSEVQEELTFLLDSFDEGKIIREGIRIAIVGKPNVGKSSLFNAFLQEERSIVTAIPGTTRDVLEVQFQLRGIPIRLFDTAGIHETTNEIEQIGIQKAEHQALAADLLILMFDGSQPFLESDRAMLEKFADHKRIIIINKIDLPSQINQAQFKTLVPENDRTSILEMSLKNKQGFTDLEALIVAKVGLGQISVDDRPVISRIRHKIALEKALDQIAQFHRGLLAHQSEDLLAVDLRVALEEIGTITGKTVSDEVIKGIFTQFCIGK